MIPISKNGPDMASVGAKNLQKRASQVLIHQKRASQVLIYQKNVQKRAKTCISNIFGPNLKTCTCEVRAAQGRVSQGLTVACDLEMQSTMDFKPQTL